MTKKLTYLLILIILTTLGYFFYSQKPITSNEHILIETLQPTDPILEAIKGMTREEKVGQMFLAGIYTQDSTKILQSLIIEKKIGSVILMNPNIKGQDVAKITALLQNAATSSGQPTLLIAVDQEGGVVSRIKNPGSDLTAQTEIKSSEQAYKVATSRGKELRKLGINVDFAPVLDYVTKTSSFLYDRVFHGTRDQAISFGTAMVKGYQEEGIAATVKHFPGHDDSPIDSHKALPSSPTKKEELSEYTHIFRQVIAGSNPLMVMTAHVLFPAIDPTYSATLSPVILDFLRNDIGYKGVIITDDMNMGAITTKFGVEDAAVQAIKAGNDILLYVAPKEVIERARLAVLNAIEAGDISEDRIDESVYRVLDLKKIVNK